MQETNKPLYAGFFVRLFAALIDGCIVFALLSIVRLPMWISTLSFEGNPFSKKILYHFSIWDIVIYLLGATYYVLMIYYEGATFGKKLLKLKVIGEEDKLSFMTVLYRETVGKYLSTAIMCIGFLLIGIDSQKRGLHDILCDTRVVYDFEAIKKDKNLEHTYMQSNTMIHSEEKDSLMEREEEK